MPRALLGVVLLSGALIQAPEVDPALKAAVERFFATQQAEDFEGYLALWSKSARQPELPKQLKYVFDPGDDKFMDLEIQRAIISGSTARVRVAVTRMRTAANVTNPDGSPRTFNTRLQFGLTYVLEDGEWKLVREGAPVDELAAALIQAPDAAMRAQLLEAEPDLVTARLVDALGRQADAKARMFLYDEAQAIYERALEVATAAKDRKAEGQMLQNIANSLYFKRQFPSALAMYEKRLALEREMKNDDGIASALIGVATIRYSTFEYSEALKLYREALEIQERLDDEMLVASTLLSTGNVQYVQGDYDGAIADYKRAETLKRKYHDLGGAATALQGLGRTYAAQGDYASALLAFGGVLDQSRRLNDPKQQAAALSSIADVHTRLANLDAARTAYDESRKLYESAKDLGHAGRALQGTGVVELMSGRLPQAEAAYEKSLALCTAARPEADAGCIAQALVGLGFAQASQERWDPAIGSYKKSIDAFLGLNAPEQAARARIGLAEALTGKEEYVAALSEATTARHTAISLDADDLLWRALVSQSRAQRRLKRGEDALGAARAAVVAVRGMSAAALRRPGYAVPRDTAMAFVNAAVLHAERGDAAGAWAAIEEMRGHALRAALAVHERDIAPGMTEEEREAERIAAADLAPLIAQREREKTLPKPDAARLKQLETKIAAATDKRTALQDALYSRLPELRVWRGLAPAITPEELDAFLAEPGELVLQFAVDDHDLLVLTATREEDKIQLQAYAVPTKRPALAERVARAVEPAVLADGEMWRKASQELLKLLPEAVVEQLSSARRVIVVPDDMLWRIPYEALPIAGAYLADLAQVRYASSVTSLVRPARPSLEAGPAAVEPTAFRAVIVADPAVPAAVVETLKTTAPGWTLRSGEAAQAEAAKIGAAAGEEWAVVLTGAAGTEEALRVAAAAASVVHAAGPFRVNAASPLFSPMLLALPEDAGSELPAANNGVLEAREIPTAGIANRLLVISDPAALSMRDSAAALHAVHWIWRSGGTEDIVVRRGASDEAASAELLANFYEALRSGSTAVEAMHAAHVKARKSETPLPPSVWAGWLVLSGR